MTGYGYLADPTIENGVWNQEVIPPPDPTPSPGAQFRFLRLQHRVHLRDSLLQLLRSIG